MKIKKILYIGAKVLTKPEVKPYHERLFIDHITLWYCANEGLTELPDFIGDEPIFWTIKYFFDNNAEAWSGCFEDEVYNDYAMNHDQPLHLTISCADGIAPAYCKDLIRNKHSGEIESIPIGTKIGAFVVFEDDSTGWVFEK